jgi:hypothetical protein
MSKVEKSWMTKAGLPAVVLIMPWGVRNGYVAVPPNHRHYGKDYNDITANVHGGLTYCGDDTKDYPVESFGAWWFGFDCRHYGDGQDVGLMDEKYKQQAERCGIYDEGHARSLAYVEYECEQLAEQLK